MLMCAIAPWHPEDPLVRAVDTRTLLGGALAYAALSHMGFLGVLNLQKNRSPGAPGRLV